MSNEDRAGRHARLRAATRAAHQGLDRYVMSLEPFASRERYVRLLRMQFRLHARIQPAFRDIRLRTLIPDMSSRCRLECIRRDFEDLGQPLPDPGAALPMVTPEALGWLYVVEGSAFGADILMRGAEGLGLSAEFGARHLAAEGRAAAWRRFTTALDAIMLDAPQERLAEISAQLALHHARTLAEQEFAGAKEPPR